MPTSPRRTKSNSKSSNTSLFGDAVKFLLGFLLGGFVMSLRKEPLTSLLTATGVPAQTEADSGQPETTSKRRPLQIFPLLKEMRAGWKSMEFPLPLQRWAKDDRALVIDIGLDAGIEFFGAMDAGFEMVGFEPNPDTFVALSRVCQQRSTCHVIEDIMTHPLPLQRQPGQSYLIHAGAGKEAVQLEFSKQGAGSSFVALDINTKPDVAKAKVQVVRVDTVIAEDVFVLKIDAQGFDHYILEGSQKLFENHVVRQVLVEIEPYAMKQLGIHKIEDTLTMLQDYGMMCFSDRNDNGRFDCDYFGDSAEGFTKKYFDGMVKDKLGGWALCWEDFLCLNIEKIYPGNIPKLLYGQNMIGENGVWTRLDENKN